MRMNLDYAIRHLEKAVQCAEELQLGEAFIDKIYKAIDLIEDVVEETKKEG